VSIIDGVMDTVITDVPVINPEGLTWNATDNKVYCVSQGYYMNNIVIINGESDQITHIIHLGDGELIILELFWSSLDNKLYCYYYESGVTSRWFHKLIIIDGVSDSILTTLSLGGTSVSGSVGFPGCFTANAQGNRIFLANHSMSKIMVIDPTATGIIPEPLTKVPERFFLQQNYPNPFNPSTIISWQLAVGSQVELTVYNVTGQRVTILVNERQPAGTHSVAFDASHLASGVYLYRLETDQFVETKKMVLMR